MNKGKKEGPGPSGCGVKQGVVGQVLQTRPLTMRMGEPATWYRDSGVGSPHVFNIRALRCEKSVGGIRYLKENSKEVAPRVRQVNGRQGFDSTERIALTHPGGFGLMGLVAARGTAGAP